MRFLLFLLFVVVPIAEIAVIIQVGQAIGVWPTVGILVLDAIVGAALMRTQGRAAWKRFTAALQAGRAPAREVTDGVLVILGGAFLLAPGFITDILGMALIAPPTRAVLRRAVLKRASERLTVSMMGAAAAAPPRRDPRDYDVDGTAVEIDPARLQRARGRRASGT